ncbi:MAG: efflux RND transporter periplasmic adaptor subunit [Chitinophagaceae bacterium]|nr:efflux RND transporter periplasmic adaptor subunit [Chitinophagaceae bacterium]
MNKYIFINIIFLFVYTNCNTHTHKETPVEARQYTCPMASDSIWSDTPGTCPKCGMMLIADEKKKKNEQETTQEAELEFLLNPTNTYVISSLPALSPIKKKQKIQVESFGKIEYDTREIGTISAKTSGRIDKLFVKYRYQKIQKGQRILDIYSPEMITAEENLIIFILKNQPLPIIELAKQKLILMGMTKEQVEQVIESKTVFSTLPIYSNYSGHIHETTNDTETEDDKKLSLVTQQLSVSEGMYLEKGSPIFLIYNPDRAWAILNIYDEHYNIIQKGDSVSLFPEHNAHQKITGIINFKEPFFKENSKTSTVRVYFNNTFTKLPIGTQVKATIYTFTQEALWIPKEAISHLGTRNIVFLKKKQGFQAHFITTGISYQNQTQILEGLQETDSILSNAQYLLDSESIIHHTTN